MTFSLVNFGEIIDADGLFVYPVGIIGATQQVGDDVVGEYDGAVVLPPYVGEWPIALPTFYKFEFLPIEFLKQLTAAEVQGVVADNNVTIRNYIDVRLQLGQLMIEPTDPAFIAFVDEMETQAIIDNARRNVLVLGVPDTPE